MFNKKSLLLVVLPLTLASFLLSQSVTELAKKEKERRAALKGKSGAVITNADLAKTKKRPAVEVTGETEKAATEAQAAGEAATPPAGQAAAADQPAEAKPAETPPPPDQTALAEKDFKARLNELATKAKDAQEFVELLTLKMNSLWQEFYNLGDVKAREFTQYQISETYDKLTKAELEAQKAKKDMDDFLATAKREGVPTIWIK